MTWWLKALPTAERAQVALELLRIGLAGVLLLRGLCALGWAGEIYGAHGILPWVVSELQLGAWVPRMSWTTWAMAPLGLDPDAAGKLIYILYLVALTALLLGAWTRGAALASLALHLILINSASLSVYGVDLYAKIGLFYLLLAQVGRRWSVDAHFAASGVVGSDLWTRLLCRMVQIHLSVAYLSAGYFKATGPQWWNGEAIWRALQTPQFDRFHTTWLAQWPWVSVLAGWGTLVLEGLYVLMIWSRWRGIWLALILSMHVAIALVLGLVWFSAVMAVLNISLFGAPAVLRVSEALLRWLRQMRILRPAIGGLD